MICQATILYGQMDCQPWEDIEFVLKSIGAFDLWVRP